jgi:two-component system chemotaxis sensor kinase CheA
LPTGSGADADTIELEILLASQAGLDKLRDAIQAPNVSIEEVPRRSTSTGRPPLVEPRPPRPGATPANFVQPAAPFDAPGDVVDVLLSVAEPANAPSVPAAGPARPAPARVAVSPGEMSLRSISQTVRVDIRKLDRLMTIVGELAIVRTGISRLTDRARNRAMGPREIAIELQRLNRTFERHLAQMQGGILEVRMVPLGQAFDKLARIVRQISREHGKDVALVVTGAETEIDKLIVEELSDPLMHMIRNAIDHGIERREDRLSVGKPPLGTIALNAFQKGNHVVIELEDDGVGMNPEAIVSAAIRRGMLTAEEARELTPREAFGLVFMPGFTTKEVATDLSGRGVGLDVVKTNIAKLGGVVDITSEIGIGTKMTITLPITLAIINVLLVDLCGRLYGVPLASVEEAIALDESQVRCVESREVLTVRGASLPICRLERLFGVERDRPPAGATPLLGAPPSSRAVGRAFVVIARVAERRLGLVVDELVGQQDIVIKPLGRSLKGVRGFAGATELGDQRVALILDVAALIEEVLVPGETRFLAVAEADAARRPAAAIRRA